MAPSVKDIRDTLQRLRRTPRHFLHVAEGVGDERLRHHPAEGSWSVHEILAHLRGAADVQGAWIVKMLADDDPTIRYVSARTGMRKTAYETQAFAPFLREFTRRRIELVKTLSSLEAGAWLRSATFTGTTPGWAPTVFDLAAGIAAHEHSHFPQIAEAAAVDGL